jgi:hypothetical protein
MKYFDVSWADSEAQMDEQARIFGPLLAWIINRNLMSDGRNADCPDVIDRVRNRATPTTFFFADICYGLCHGKLCDHDLSDEGSAFMQHYLADDLRRFTDDYFGTLDEDMADCDFWDTFDQLAPVLDRRFEEWRASQK